MTTRLTESARKNPGALSGSSVSFVFPEGTIFIDPEQRVTLTNESADCVILTSLDTLAELMSGQVNAMMAVMSGKLKIKGDMSVAMKLQSLLN